MATLAGAVESALFAPAIYFIRQIRRENMKLRMLELPLSSAKNADEAAAAIIKLFAEEFSDNTRGKMLRPRHYASNVALELVQGLTNGSIVLDILQPEAALDDVLIADSRGRDIAIRCRDLLFATMLLIPLSPVLLIIALLIKLTSNGPILQRSLRVGRAGKPFTLLRFRSMVVNERRWEYGHYGNFAPVFKMTNDPRVTPLGKMLRKYSLDQLPQLFNVLAGDMSLIGPLPLSMAEFEYANSEYAHPMKQRIMVRPGMIGLWQVKGRSKNEISFQEMMALDTEYIQRRSFWLDFAIPIQLVLRGFRASH